MDVDKKRKTRDRLESSITVVSEYVQNQKKRVNNFGVQ